MQINRLFEIVYILLDKKSITANELAEHFDYPKNHSAGHRNINHSGNSIYTTKGKGGGIP